MKKNKILIIGGGGFVGKWLVKSFCNKKWECSVIDPNIKKNTFLQSKTKHLLKFSISEKNLLQKALELEKWNTVVFLSAWGGEGKGLLNAADQAFDKALEVNVIGFSNVLDKLKYSKQTKILWSSSTVVYGEEINYSKGKADEKSKILPKTNYGLTKVLAEEVANFYIREHKMKITGIRLPLVIGPGLNYRGVAAGISDMANAFKGKKTIKLDMPNTPLDILYIKDVSEIFINLILNKGPLKSIYNAPSYRTQAHLIAKQFNKEAKREYVKINSIRLGNTYPKMKYDSLKKDIKYSIKYSLKRTIADWIKELQIHST